MAFVVSRSWSDIFAAIRHRHWVGLAYLGLLHFCILILLLKLFHFQTWLGNELNGVPTYKFGSEYEGAVLAEIGRSQQMHGGIAVIGDSHIELMAVSQIAPHAENFGVIGDDLDHAIYRMQRLNLSHASSVLIALGINDWHTHRLLGFRKRYAAMLDTIPQSVPVIASAILPVNPPMTEARAYNAKNFWGAPPLIAKANEDIRVLCVKRSSCTFVPVPLGMSDARGWLPNNLTKDGVHLNAIGYQIWNASLASIVSKE